MGRRAPEVWRQVLPTLRSEGVRGVRERALERLALRSRRRTFESLGSLPTSQLEAAEQHAQVPFLSILPTPLRPDFGGVQQQLLRRLENSPSTWALLTIEPPGYRLEIQHEGRYSLEYRAQGPTEDLSNHPTFARVVRHASDVVGARGVHVEHCAGLPFEELIDLAEGGLDLVLSIHDFSLFCSRPHLLERPQLAFCNFCRDEERCARCLGTRVEGPSQGARRAVAERLLTTAAAVIFPSAYFCRVHGALFEVSNHPTRWHVVPPPTFAEPRQAVLSKRDSIRHIAWVGSVQPHKGGNLLSDLIGTFEDSEETFRFSIFGRGDRKILEELRRHPSVEIHGYYRSGTLVDRLRSCKPDLALVPSILPESYCMALDECWAADVPALCFDLGAQAERLRRVAGGALVDLERGVEGLVTEIRRFQRDGFAGVEPAFDLSDAGQTNAAIARIYRALESATSQR